MKIWHWGCFIGAALMLWGFFSVLPYPYHIGFGLVTLSSFLGWVGYHSRQVPNESSLYAILFLILWYTVFEYAAWLSSENVYSDLTLRGLGILPTILVFLKAMEISGNGTK